MEPKYSNYPDAILLKSQRFVNLLDCKTGRIWSASWNHQEHSLLAYEITNSTIVPIAKETAFNIIETTFLIINPHIEDYEALLQLSFENEGRVLNITLLKRSYLAGLDLQINNEIIYYGHCSPYYGSVNTVDDGETIIEIDGTLLDKFPAFTSASVA